MKHCVCGAILAVMTLFSCANTPSFSSSSSSQSTSVSQEISTVRVAFAEAPHYYLPQYLYEVPKGGQLEVEVSLLGRYTLTGLDYADSSFEILEGAKAKVLLRNIRYNTRVNLTFDLVQAQYVYHLNGGSFLRGEGDSFRLPCSDRYHARPNLDIGVDRIYRPQHTLIGWEDEEGELIGLGSRYTIPDKKETHFTATWAAWNPAGDFSYILRDEGAFVTGYFGPLPAKDLIIPATLGGEPVYGIRADFVARMDFQTLVLPLSLRVIEAGAFRQCNIGKLYLYDDLSEVENDSFDQCSIQEFHLLAAHPSKGLGEDPNTQFAEDMDRLILRQNKKKIVFFAGCSGSYSISSPMMVEAFGDEYEMCNMAVLGNTNASAMFEAMIPYLGPGDLFVNGPEMMSEYQILHNLEADNRLFFLFMGNYDLLSKVNINIIGNFWGAFDEYLDLAAKREEETFDARCSSYNEYGDFILPRPNSSDDADYHIAGCFLPHWVNAESCGRLNAYYEAMQRQGAKTLFTFGPINQNAVARLDPKGTDKKAMLENVKRYLTVPTIISSMDDSIFPGRYFFDTDYHMSEEGRDLRTANLIRDIKAYLAS